MFENEQNLLDEKKNYKTEIFNNSDTHRVIFKLHELRIKRCSLI